MAAAAATILASCSKEPNTNTGDASNGQVIVKLADVHPATRAIQAPGQEVAATLSSGYVFVFGPTGDFVHGETLNVTDAKSNNGQKLTAVVPSDSRVYVVGNVPGGYTTANLEAIFGSDEPIQADVLAAMSAMSTQTDYTKAALANKAGTPAAITQKTPATASNPAVYVADIILTPLFSRLELVAIQGGMDEDEGVITGFDVTGVYVDEYYENFTYAGKAAGNKWMQNQSTVFTGNIGDKGTWTATDVNDVWIADTGSTNVWAYNVASGGAVIPRLIIELKNIKYTPKGSVEEPIVGTYYLTVTSYSGVTTFERGKIYRIGTIGKNDFTFSKDDLGITPNPTNVELVVTVEIDEWEVVEPTAGL